MSWVPWVIVGIFAIVAILLLLRALRVGSQWDAALERVIRIEAHCRCQQFIAENPDEDCTECGWSKIDATLPQ